jgi:transposase
MPLPPAKALTMTEGERRQLTSLSEHRSTPRGIVLRVQIVLDAARGMANREIARRNSTSVPTVLLWRKRWANGGVPELLEDLPRSGRPKQISEEKEDSVVQATVRTTPKDATHWSTRTMAAAQGVSSATVHRIWQKHKLQPHRSESFKFSSDPDFSGKVRDIVGLYLNPPDKAIVLSVDEKSQIQALDRTQPVLPLREGLPERQTHDYRRHGTTTLFAALNILEGTIIARCQPRHRHQEFLRFLHQIDESIPEEREVHLVLDNYGTHKHPQVREWFAKRPRYHLHFTPTSSSWLNQIERWFAEITRKRIRRGTFRSVPELVRAIEDYIGTYNQNPRPFQWVASAANIIRKVRKYKAISDTVH